MKNKPHKHAELRDTVKQLTIDVDCISGDITDVYEHIKQMRAEIRLLLHRIQLLEEEQDEE